MTASQKLRGLGGAAFGVVVGVAGRVEPPRA